MAKNEKRPKGWLVGKKQVDDWQALATLQIKQKEYKVALQTCRRILQVIPKRDKIAAEVWEMIGMNYAMQNEFEKSYQTFCKACEIDPGQARIFYNRGLSAMYTSRSGEALADFELAVMLDGNGKMSEKYREQVTFVRKIVAGELALRGAEFTLEQLIEQQELFQRGNQLSMQAKWQEAEECFRKSIEMGDCLPQPQGNLGICLAMQKKFDEAEAAYRRALEIDLNYERAHEHLQNLASMRAFPDEMPEYKITSPFEKAKPDITFVE